MCILMNMYVIVWKYTVTNVPEFLRHYGAEGTWVRFFRGGEGYLRTELFRSAGAPNEYLTLDYWRSRADFVRFSEANRAEYERIDRELEGLMSREERVGAMGE